jgi:hypothetical protein
VTAESNVQLKTTLVTRERLSQPVSSLELPGRGEKLLRAAGIATVGELLLRSDSELDSILRSGGESLKSVQERLLAERYLVPAGVDLSRGLAAQAWAQLNRYLVGELDGAQVSQWATQMLSSHKSIEPPLLVETLVALANLDHDDERFNTPKEDLRFLTDCLLGKESYRPLVRIEHSHRTSSE